MQNSRERVPRGRDDRPVMTEEEEARQSERHIQRYGDAVIAFHRYLAEHDLPHEAVIAYTVAFIRSNGR